MLKLAEFGIGFTGMTRTRSIPKNHACAVTGKGSGKTCRHLALLMALILSLMAGFYTPCSAQGEGGDPVFFRGRNFI